MEMGLWCHANRSILKPLHDGFPLTTIKDRCIKFLALADELKQEAHAGTVKIGLQGILNLMALDEETTDVNGTVCQVDELEMETFGNQVNFMKLLLLVYFREYDNAAKMAIKDGDALDKDFPGPHDGMYEAFL